MYYKAMVRFALEVSGDIKKYLLFIKVFIGSNICKLEFFLSKFLWPFLRRNSYLFSIFVFYTPTRRYKNCAPPGIQLRWYPTIHEPFYMNVQCLTLHLREYILQ